MDKKAWTDRGEVRLKEGKKFPVGQAVGVLKWRVTGKDESVVPISSKFYYSQAFPFPQLLIIRF